ncbi:MAG TPA: hypothetical protein VGK67_24625 [Myxococcales bacterium]
MGEVVSLFQQRFRVRVLYREPTYAATTGREPRTYSGTFEVSARTAQQAGDAALRQFEKIERQSGVGWAREVVDLQIVPVPGFDRP